MTKIIYSKISMRNWNPILPITCNEAPQLETQFSNNATFVLKKIPIINKGFNLWSCKVGYMHNKSIPNISNESENLVAINLPAGHFSNPTFGKYRNWIYSLSQIFASGKITYLLYSFYHIFFRAVIGLCNCRTIFECNHRLNSNY